MRTIKYALNKNLKLDRSHFMYLCMFFFITKSISQSNIEHVLSEITKNNPTIIANRQYLESQNLKYRTGLTPSDPTIEYDFLIGRPANAGNQHDVTLVQAFDFPTVYKKKSQLANQQVAQSEFELKATRQHVLIETEKICIELVYYNKLQTQLNRQKQSIEKLLSNIKTKLDKGESTILDVNKVQLQFIEFKKQVQENISAVEQLNSKLSSLNGGTPIAFADTFYFTPSLMPSLKQLETEIEVLDPHIKILEQKKAIAQKQVELKKALWLPKFELGYRYQGILSQTYNGIHTGLSIPLWENKNTVKTQQSELIFTELKIQEYRVLRYSEIKALYDKLANLSNILQEYQNAFGTFNNTEFLNKALAFGQITIIDYFLEMNYYNTAFNNYLKIEKDYYMTLVELFKHRR